MKGKFIVVRLGNLIFIAAVTLAAIVTIVIVLGMIANANAPETGKLAVIIDDFGGSRQGVATMMNIDRKLTFAIMPLLEHSEGDMLSARKKGHQVIIHIPLQYSHSDNLSWLGKHSVRISNTDEEIKGRIRSFMDNLPLAEGANFHMGALGSGDARVMTGIMETLRERGLFFVDSKTNSKSVCKAVAKAVGIPFAENQFFLENKGKSYAAIRRQLLRAAQAAKRRGSAIAIGHIGGESNGVTSKVIRDNLKEIEDMGVEFVHVSALIAAQE